MTKHSTNQSSEEMAHAHIPIGINRETLYLSRLQFLTKGVAQVENEGTPYEPHASFLPSTKYTYLQN